MPEPQWLELDSPVGHQRLRIEFSWAVDRWSHRFLVGPKDQTSSEPFELLTSLEGTPDQCWPPSPPLQDISRHELPLGAAILGVGMAGSGHWSASFSVEPWNSQSPTESLRSLSKGIKVDLACLRKESSGRQVGAAAAIGCEYRVSTETIVEAEQDAILLTTPSKMQLRISPFPATERKTSTKWEGSELRLAPEEPAAGKAPQLLANANSRSSRWGFWVRWV